MLAYSQGSADGVSALHSRYHDAMHGTFATDRHHNLPRPLRSYVSSKTPNISIVATSPPMRLAPSCSPPLASVYQTPEWTEFNDCVREVSQRVESEESNEDETATAAGSASSCATSKEYDSAEAKAFANASPLSLERSVVDRLAELSQSADPDAKAVAAALRDAERLLKHPSSHAPLNVEESEERPERARHAVARTPWTDAAAPRDGSPYKQPGSHHHHRRSRRDSHRERAPTPPLPHLLHRGWGAGAPTHWPPAYPSYPPAGDPSLAYAGSRDSAAAGHQQSWPATADVILPSMAAAVTSGTAASWYEVYYAWMLYYQQLYAAQIVQQERAERHRRREGERGRQRQRHKGHRQTAAGGAQTGGGEGTACGVDPQPLRGMGEAKEYVSAANPVGPPSRQQREDRPARSHSARPSGDAEESARRRGGESTRPYPTSTEDDPQRLREQLRQLEAQLASLSAAVHNYSNGSVQGQDASAHRDRQHHRHGGVRGRATSAERGNTALSSARLQSSPQAAPRATSGPVSTWKALAERQRSRSSAGGEQRRQRGATTSTASQRPQWR